MNDVITLTGLTAFGYHGVFDFERRDGQDFTIDVVLHLDLSRAAASDDVADTVHYGELADAVVEIIVGPPFDLIEKLAEQIADAALAYPLVDSVDVTVHKPQAPIAHQFADVSVTVTRLRPGATVSRPRPGATATPQGVAYGRIERSEDGREALPLPPAATLTSAVLALGANLGDAAATLQFAVDALDAHIAIDVSAVSGVYRTEPVGGVAQPDFLNAVVVVETALGPYELLAAVNAIEGAAGRMRTVRWGPRTLDIDIIVHGGWASDDPRLTVPHPRAAERAFVLVPWAEVQPEAELAGAPVAELAERAGDFSGVRRDASIALTARGNEPAGKDEAAREGER